MITVLLVCALLLSVCALVLLSGVLATALWDWIRLQ